MEDVAGAVIVVYPPIGPWKVGDAVTYTMETSVCAGSGEGSASAKGLGITLARADAQANGLPGLASRR